MKQEAILNISTGMMMLNDTSLFKRCMVRVKYSVLLENE